MEAIRRRVLALAGLGTGLLTAPILVNHPVVLVGRWAWRGLV
jgi:hypothetical protein